MSLGGVLPGGPASSLLIGRLGSRLIVSAGLALQAAALAWIAILNTAHVHYATLVPAFVIAGFGLGMSLAPMAAVVLSSTPEADHGKASGVNNTMRELGVALGVAVLTAVFSAAGGYQSAQDFVNGVKPAVWVGAIVVAVGAVISLALPGPQPAAPAPLSGVAPQARPSTRRPSNPAGPSAQRTAHGRHPGTGAPGRTPRTRIPRTT